MSRTTRRHESRGRRSRRGPKNAPEESAPKTRLKTVKQTRVNERAALRREWR